MPDETKPSIGLVGGQRAKHVDLTCLRLLIGLGTSVLLFGQSPWLCIDHLAV